jgi:hypothetical protein
MTHNLNNFILMISLSRLKNTINKNFNYIEIKNNIISVQLKPFFSENITIIQEEPVIEKSNIKKNNSDDNFIIQDNNESLISSSISESNYLFTSFINVADTFKFNLEDWYFIYDDVEQIKNK